jgi:WD40 repeat protein
MESAICHLSFSPNGKHLVANLGSGKGIRLFGVKDGKWNLLGSDSNYEKDSYWSEFSPDGKTFATTCYDGMIRIYSIDEIGNKKEEGDNINGQGRAAALPNSTIKTVSGTQPFSLSFSPDGKEIAVGYANSTNVDIYTTTTVGTHGVRPSLEYSHSPDTKDIDNGNLGSVAYSGDFLYAGVNNLKNGITRIRRWEKRGRGKYIDLAGSLNTIMHILPTLKSGIVYGTFDPALGLYTEKAERLFFKGPSIADYRNMRTTTKSEFLVSENSESIGFWYDYDGKNKALFSLSDRVIQSNVSDTLDPSVKTRLITSLRAPILTHDKIKIENWYNEYYPKLNGNRILLEENEIARSIAIHPKEESFLLGTEWYLRYYDKTGKELWKNPVPGAAWAVNISGDGRFALAAFGDGTIRWYRITDGKELLAFFPHADQKRWVLWSPEGYYDASVDGEDLIGWHINRGKDKESDFFSVGKFRDTYYRPDIITKILEVGDSQKAILAANESRQKKSEALSISKSLPSVVSILLPESGKPVKGEIVDFRTTIRSPSGLKVKELKVFIDNSFVDSFPVDFTPSNPEDITDFKFQLKVPQKKSMEISIVTVTEKGVSDPQRIVLLGKDGADKKPNLHLLAVGVGDYKDNKNVKTLHYSVTDARDFFSIMKKQAGKVYDKVNAEEKYILTNETATRAKIIYLIKEIRNRTTPDDVTMVFLSGHGTSDVDNMFYFLPYDYNSSPEEKDATGLSGSELMTHLSKVKGKVILFVDACYSGNLSSGGLNMVRLLNEANDPDKRFVVFSSSSKFEESLENSDWKNGAFTKAFKEAMLEGKLNEPEITVKDLDAYISKRVRKLTKNKQTPESQGTGRDFIIAEAIK